MNFILSFEYGLDKIANDYRRSHQERKELVQRWQQTLEQLQKKDLEMDELSLVIWFKIQNLINLKNPMKTLIGSLKNYTFVVTAAARKLEKRKGKWSWKRQTSGTLRSFLNRRRKATRKWTRESRWPKWCRRRGGSSWSTWRLQRSMHLERWVGKSCDLVLSQSSPSSSSSSSSASSASSIVYFFPTFSTQLLAIKQELERTANDLESCRGQIKMLKQEVLIKRNKLVAFELLSDLCGRAVVNHR